MRKETKERLKSLRSLAAVIGVICLIVAVLSSLIHFSVHDTQKDVYDITFSSGLRISSDETQVIEPEYLRSNDTIIRTQYSWRAGIWASGKASIFASSLYIEDIKDEFDQTTLPRRIIRVDTLVIKNILVNRYSRGYLEKEWELLATIAR